MQHENSIKFQEKISAGAEVLAVKTNNKVGDYGLSAVEFSDGAIGIFSNGEPEWVGSWAEALQILEDSK